MFLLPDEALYSGWKIGCTDEQVKYQVTRPYVLGASCERFTV